MPEERTVEEVAIEAVSGVSEYEERIPSNKELGVLDGTYKLFRETAELRDTPFALLDDMTIIEKIDDSVQQFITNEYSRPSAEDWQAKVNQPFSRNKVMAILSKVSSVIPNTEVVAVGDEDIVRARLVNDLKEHADRVDDDEELIFYTLLEAAVKGTAVGYEGYEETERKVRDIVKYDGADKLVLKEGSRKVRKLTGKIVPLEDFYPSSPYIRRIKDMPYCFWRTVMSLEQFKKDFYMFERTKYVQGYNRSSSANEQEVFYASALDEGDVEVLRYYNQDTDEYILVANKTWLNPVGEQEDISPLPFIHKTLPFWSTIYEPLGAFFYGKSIIDKLFSTQVTLNTLYNMMLDQGFLSIFPPILVEGIDDIEDDYLRPGRRIPVQNPNNYKELAISAPHDFHRFILEFTKRTLEETSVDAVNQGVAGVGDRVTATEIQRAAAGVEAALGLFIKFVKWGLRDKARLRVKNILQFYNKPLVEGVLGDGGSSKLSKAFNTIKIENTSLTSGKRGTKVIEIFKSDEEMPTRSTVKLQAEILTKKTGVRTEKIAIMADYIRDFEFDLKMVMKRDPEINRALDKGLMLEKARIYLEFFPDIVDRTELAFQIAEAFGDRPERMFSEPTLENILAPRIAGVGAPASNMPSNMMRQAQGSEGIEASMGNMGFQ